MRYSIGLSNEVLDTITNNDYLFCEDKVISLVSKYYGTEYEMAYARCFNFQYKINNTITKVGDKIILYYKDTIELLKKYYGISMTKSENNRDNCYEAINEELKYGKPVIVALDNSQKLWVERAESIDMLIYLITWVEPDKVELLDFHDWGKRKIISKDELCNSFLWMVTVDKESAERKLGVKDVLDDLLHDVNINIDDSRNSFDVISKFLNIQNIGYKEQDKKNGDIKDFWNGARVLRPEPPYLERGGAAANCVNITRESRLSKNLPGQKFRREEKCERKPSGFPFAFHQIGRAS